MTRTDRIRMISGIDTFLRCGTTLLLAAAVLVATDAAENAGEEQEKDEKDVIRVVVVTGGHGFEREQFFAMFDAMPGIEWKEVVHPEANKLYTEEASKEYDVLVLYDMNQEITEEQKQEFARLIEGGEKGLVALHHSLADYQTWNGFGDIVGGHYFFEEGVVDGAKRPGSTFKHGERFTVQIADPLHPVTAGMKDFEILDETYNGFQVNESATPLLRADHATSGPVIGWTNKYGKSNVVYIQLGHDHTTYDDENYRTLVANAIRWTANKK